MTRLIKRYGSRKLYDTDESRYISLEEIAQLVRENKDIEVIDNKTGEDVTSQTLIQVISEEGRKKGSFLSRDFLHDLIRKGEEKVTKGVKQIQMGVEKIVTTSIDKITPVSQARQEMDILKKRLVELESSLAQLEEKK